VIRPFDDLLNLEKTAKVQDNDIPVEDE
jgi:hypothetical protein